MDHILEKNIESWAVWLEFEKRVSKRQKGYCLFFKFRNQDNEINFFFLQAFVPYQGIKS